MTNLLHRHGSLDLLRKDYIIKNKTTKSLDDGTPEIKQQTIERTRELIRLLTRHNPVNMGQARLGSFASGLSLEELLAGVSNAGSLSACVFTDLTSVKYVLIELLKRDLGQSITVSGLIDEVFSVCREIYLEPHSILLSLGIWGQRKLLPRQDVLELTTMCGHGLVSRRLVERVGRDVRAGRLSVQEAARIVARPCRCGAVNLEVAADIISRLADGQMGGDD